MSQHKLPVSLLAFTLAGLALIIGWMTAVAALTTPAASWKTFCPIYPYKQLS